MNEKRLIIPKRARRLPAHWSWVDHRLVRENHFGRCSPSAWTLYLFLIVVGDAQGLSYYSDRSIARRVGWSIEQLDKARRELLEADLLAYGKPLYQVLDLSPASDEEPATRTGQSLSLGDLFQRALEHTRQGGGND